MIYFYKKILLSKHAFSIYNIIKQLPPPPHFRLKISATKGSGYLSEPISSFQSIEVGPFLFGDGL